MDVEDDDVDFDDAVGEGIVREEDDDADGMAMRAEIAQMISAPERYPDHLDDHMYFQINV